MTEMPRILCVHQGYELYGSDRTFVSSLLAIRSEFPAGDMTVLLPKPGELADLLEQEGFKVRISNFWIARRVAGVIGNLLKSLAFPGYVLRAIRDIRSHDLCYINTSVVFDYAVAARFVRTPVVIHIHEIPAGFALRVIHAIIRFSGRLVIFNSEATQKAFDKLGKLPGIVVLNGVPDVARPSPAPVGHGEGVLRLLMIGRVNSWKGQDLLVHAIALMPEALAAQIDVRFVGASFENGAEMENLKGLVDRLGVKCKTTFDGYILDPSSAYSWADVVVVPSKKPEPFGLVAVEAMAHGRALVVARHGGLTEIVTDSVNGLFFSPNSPVELADCLVELVQQPSAVTRLGAAGRATFLERFQESRYRSQVARTLKDCYESSSV